MQFTKFELFIYAIVLLSFVLASYSYLQMPEQIASHWNAAGRADAVMPKFWGLFIAPIISLGMLLLFILIPRVDPLKANIAKFRKYFNWFIMAIFAFMLYLQVLIIAWNTGTRFNMMHAMVPVISLLFYCSGVLIEKAKRNWFIGIRTPWTMSSEKVWDKTHKIGGKLFKISAVIALLGLFARGYAILFVLVPIILATAYLIVFSYFEYKKGK